MEFELDGREDEARHDGPEIIAGPAEADDDEELGSVRVRRTLRRGLALVCGKGGRYDPFHGALNSFG